MIRSRVRNIIGEKRYNYLRGFKRFIKKPGLIFNYGIDSFLGVTQLSELGKVHGTDKADANHSFMDISYLDIYEKYFIALKHKDISLLEIGVKNGSSLKTWKSYFNKGSIFGIDIDPRCKQLEENRISIEIGSQDDPEFLQTVFESNLEFDIIIDDGSHINSFTIASFEHLFNKRLKSNGIYIIEDLRCSYNKLQTNSNILETWPGMKYNDPSKSYDNDRSDMNNFFFEKIEKLDHLKGNILCIHFWPMTCVIIKA